MTGRVRSCGQGKRGANKAIRSDFKMYVAHVESEDQAKQVMSSIPYRSKAWPVGSKESGSLSLLAVSELNSQAI